ncbi:hypothetical protein F0562_002053 [Nyssa sinensis]|uniref:Uncharacterized protein n=1 Tax=Nyssa sinensis TaxID=561372 RepID=A0A5J5C5C8_9ASTE|nr:hypothetical protein F0562_002053 [Nyssa sinensis]
MQRWGDRCDETMDELASSGLSEEDWTESELHSSGNRAMACRWRVVQQGANSDPKERFNGSQSMGTVHPEAENVHKAGDNLQRGSEVAEQSTGQRSPLQQLTGEEIQWRGSIRKPVMGQ